MLGEHILPHSEVIRAILLEDSPFCGAVLYDQSAEIKKRRKLHDS